MTSIASLQAAHTERQKEWCPDQQPDLSFRGNEMAGEVGEACNIIKKLERERQGWRGSRATKEELADELADVIHTAILCAITAGVDLEAATVNKFNATSRKNGLGTILAPSAPMSGVTVRELDWEYPTDATNGCHVAQCAFGTYSAVNEQGWYVTLDEHPWGQGFEWTAPDMRMTFEDAKAAAQADYEARILAALAPGDAVAVAWRYKDETSGIWHYVEGYEPVRREHRQALHTHPDSSGEAVRELADAAKALLANWDKGMIDGMEKLKTYDGVEYWSPRSAQVDSEFIAALRAALSTINGGVTK